MKTPHLHLTWLDKHQSAIEMVLAILVAEGRLTLSGDIGEKINAQAAALKDEPLPNPLTGDTV
jgi:hypothetical protein